MFIYFKMKTCFFYLGLEFLMCQGTVSWDVASYRSPGLIPLVPEAGGFGSCEGRSKPKNFLPTPSKQEFCFCERFCVPPMLSPVALPRSMRFSSENHGQLLGFRDSSRPRCIFAEMEK